MSGTMTTTRNGFKVEDVTFRHARMQSEVAREMGAEESEDAEVKAPASCTPEQVSAFFREKIVASHDGNERRAYSAALEWIDELQAARRELSSFREREVLRKRSEGLEDDIPMDEHEEIPD